MSRQNVNPISYYPTSGGGNGPSGGGAGGMAALPNFTAAPATTEIAAVKVISAVMDSTSIEWQFDIVSNKFKLNISANGQNVRAQSGFYTINSVKTEAINNQTVTTVISDVYYFDAEGSMITGWVKTSDNKTFFFENAKTIDEGKMVIGWKQISGDWYYFNADGSMLQNAITPDGYQIGADGKWCDF